MGDQRGGEVSRFQVSVESFLIHRLIIIEMWMI
jgi:hypothetical protein